MVGEIDEINDTRHFSALVELSSMRRTPLRGYRRETREKKMAFALVVIAKGIALKQSLSENLETRI